MLGVSRLGTGKAELSVGPAGIGGIGGSFLDSGGVLFTLVGGLGSCFTGAGSQLSEEEGAGGRCGTWVCTAGIGIGLFGTGILLSANEGGIGGEFATAGV